MESVAVALLHQQLALQQQQQHDDPQQQRQGEQLQRNRRGPLTARTGTTSVKSGPDRVTAIDPNTITT